MLPSLRRCLLLAACAPSLSFAQDRLPSYPGYQNYLKMRGELGGAVKRGDVRVRWIDGGKSFLFSQNGKQMRYDIASRQATASEESPAQNSAGNSGGRRRAPERGRQFTEAFSPDGKYRIFSKGSNAWLSDADGKNEVALTTDGSPEKRLKYASGSWVYGEELDQREAMGFSPDGKWAWFYRFDESKVIDYYLTVNEAQVQNRLYVEAYPKAGAPNPIVDVIVVEVATKKLRTAPVRPGAYDDGMGCYVYGFDWTPDGKELTFHRTNRDQNVMEWCAFDPTTGKVRVIITEKATFGWTDNSPNRSFLARQPGGDVKEWRNKLVWFSERNGFQNLYLVDLTSGASKPITQNKFDVENIVKIDLSSKKLWYMARDGDNPYKLQLHRVSLDGTGDVRLTDPALSHSVQLAPDGKSFVDTAESVDVPPVTRVYDSNGKFLSELARSDVSKFETLKLERTERLRFLAADGRTEIYGTLSKPSNFDRSRKYPLLVQVYGGPESGGGPERFGTPNPLTEVGFLIASFESRGTNGRGAMFKRAMYLNLGGPEIDDQAAGVKYLAQRPYVDATRVGIEGTSYGGYASAMAILRYPDVFYAASASSSVTDWRNYDTIYTERYMKTPQLNPEGYKRGSCMTYADQLKGRLLLYYGTADDNVHPSNTHQLTQALTRAGKGFEVQVGADEGHSAINYNRMLEFFVERLVVNR